MQVLVGVVVFLALETECHTQLGADLLEVRLGRVAAGEVAAAGDGLVAVFVVAVIVGGVLAGVDGHILDVERARRGYAGAGGHAAVFRREDVAVAVQHLEAVGARGAALELVGVRAGGALRHGDGLGGIVGGEGQLPAHGGEVLALDGAEGDGAVVDGLADGRVAATGNREGAAAVGHAERAGRKCTALPYHHCHYGQQQYGKDS